MQYLEFEGAPLAADGRAPARELGADAAARLPGCTPMRKVDTVILSVLASIEVEAVY